MKITYGRKVFVIMTPDKKSILKEKVGLISVEDKKDIHKPCTFNKKNAIEWIQTYGKDYETDLIPVEASLSVNTI